MIDSKQILSKKSVIKTSISLIIIVPLLYIVLRGNNRDPSPIGDTDPVQVKFIRKASPEIVDKPVIDRLHDGQEPTNEEIPRSSLLVSFLKKKDDIISTTEGRDRHQALLQLMSQASEELALKEMDEFCSGIDDVGVAATGMKWLGARFAVEDPSGGFKWLAGLTSDISTNSAFTGFAAALPAEKLPEAIDFALKLRNPAMANSLLGGIASTGTPESISKVIEVINRNPNLLTSPVEISSFPAAMINAGQFDSITGLCSKIESSPLRQAAYRNAVMSVVNDSPTKAAKLVETISNPEDQASVVDALMGPWLRLDAVASSKWAATLPQGAVRDTAASSVVSAVVTINQEDALKWAMSIDSEGLRKKEIEKVLNHVTLHSPDQLGRFTAISQQHR